MTLGATVGNAVVVDDAGIGTILNNDPLPLTIMEIQGAGHWSEYEGQPVITQGVVTALAANGFYLQDPNGDGDQRTSDGVFVYTGAAPTVAVGDASEHLRAGDGVRQRPAAHRDQRHRRQRHRAQP